MNWLKALMALTDEVQLIHFSNGRAKFSLKNRTGFSFFAEAGEGS